MVTVREYQTAQRVSPTGAWIEGLDQHENNNVISKQPRRTGVTIKQGRQRRVKMALTRDFIETIKNRADREPKFRRGLLEDAVTELLGEEPELGRQLLRNYIKATVGFEKLAAGLGDINATSLMRMLSPLGNPTQKNLSAIVAFLEKHEGVDLIVKASPIKRTLENA